VQELLAAIDRQLLATRSDWNQRMTDAEEDAYNRALAWSLANPIVTPAKARGADLTGRLLGVAGKGLGRAA
jgi:hypothetical protein